MSAVIGRERLTFALPQPSSEGMKTAKPWFPSGLDDPDLGLLEITARAVSPASTAKCARAARQRQRGRTEYFLLMPGAGRK